MVFHNKHKTRGQIARNWRKALMSNEKLRVLFLAKVQQIYQIKFDKFIK